MISYPHNYIIYGLLIGTIFSALPFISGKEGKEPRFKLIGNVVLVKDTDHCNNNCFHIHHWMWLGLVVIYTLFVTGYQSWITQLTFGLWISSTIVELYRYSDALKITQKCFPKCKVNKK